MTSLSWPNASVERKRSGRLCLGYCLCYQATDKQNKIGGWISWPLFLLKMRKKGVNLLKLIQNIHVTKWSFLMYSSTGTTLQHVSFNLRCIQSRLVSTSLKQSFIDSMECTKSTSKWKDKTGPFHYRCTRLVGTQKTSTLFKSFYYLSLWPKLSGPNTLKEKKNNSRNSLLC